MVDYSATASVPTHWFNVGSITEASTAFTATGRAVATANSTGSTKVVTLSFEMSVPHALLLRFRSDGSDDADNVIDVCVARGNDDYTRIASLTATQGQQLDSDNIYFADAITAANEDTLFDGEESSGTTDYIAHYYVRTLGFDKFIFQVTTLASTTVYIDACYLWE